MANYLKAHSAIGKYQKAARQEWWRKFAIAFCGAAGLIWFSIVLWADTTLK